MIWALLIVSVRVAHQRRMIEKLVKCLAPVARIHGRIHQFAQVLDPRISLGCVFLFKLLDVARAIDEEFQNLGGVSGAAGSAEGRISNRL